MVVWRVALFRFLEQLGILGPFGLVVTFVLTVTIIPLYAGWLGGVRWRFPGDGWQYSL